MPNFITPQKILLAIIFSLLCFTFDGIPRVKGNNESSDPIKVWNLLQILESLLTRKTLAGMNMEMPTSGPTCKAQPWLGIHLPTAYYPLF